jgi:hypothetical protein
MVSRIMPKGDELVDGPGVRFDRQARAAVFRKQPCETVANLHLCAHTTCGTSGSFPSTPELQYSNHRTDGAVESWEFSWE